jgi:hypothetical protein
MLNLPSTGGSPLDDFSDGRQNSSRRHMRSAIEKKNARRAIVWRSTKSIGLTSIFRRAPDDRQIFNQ